MCILSLLDLFFDHYAFPSQLIKTETIGHVPPKHPQRDADLAALQRANSDARAALVVPDVEICLERSIMAEPPSQITEQAAWLLGQIFWPLRGAR